METRSQGIPVFFPAGAGTGTAQQLQFKMQTRPGGTDPSEE